MNVLIKDFVMPTKKEECPFLDYEDGTCHALLNVKDNDEINHCVQGIDMLKDRPEWCPLIESPDHDGYDSISRQAAIDAPEKLIKDCNPDHFVGHQKFIEFMDNTEIGSFGNWQFSNGFNMGLTAAEVTIKNLPSSQPTVKHGEWVLNLQGNWACSLCGNDPYHSNMENMNYCPNCGARLDR